MNHSSLRPPAVPLPRTRRTSAVLVGALAAILTLFAPASAASAQSAVVGGQVDWGIKASFVGYITGPIAHGSISTSGGASGGFTFPNASGTTGTDSFSVDVAGSVHFTGHDGALDLTIANIGVSRSGSSGALIADVESKDLDTGVSTSFSGITLADLNFVGITPTVSGDTTTYTGVPASLTAAAVPALANFYPAGSPMDPVSITLIAAPDDEVSPDGSTTTTAAPTSTTAVTSTTIDDTTDGPDITPTTVDDGATAVPTTVAAPLSPTGGGVQGSSVGRPTSLPRTGSSPALIIVGAILVLSGAFALAAGHRARATTI